MPAAASATHQNWLDIWPGLVLSPAISPAMRLPSAVAMNHSPMICPTIRAGASFVIELSPTGLTHSSPMVCRRYMSNNHTGKTGPAIARCAPTAMTT